MQERSSTLYYLLVAYTIVREEEGSDFLPGEVRARKGRGEESGSKSHGKQAEEDDAKSKSKPKSKKDVDLANGKGNISSWWQSWIVFGISQSKRQANLLQSYLRVCSIVPCNQ